MWKSLRSVRPATTVTVAEAGVQPGFVAVNVYVPAVKPPTLYSPRSFVSTDPVSGPNQDTVAYATFVSPKTAPSVGDGARWMRFLLNP
jgi:hypothetical protein